MAEEAAAAGPELEPEAQPQAEHPTAEVNRQEEGTAEPEAQAQAEDDPSAESNGAEDTFAGEPAKPRALFRASSIDRREGFETAQSSCEQSLLVTGIPRVQCTVESMSFQFQEYGDVVSVVVGHDGQEDDDELNDGCAIVTFMLPDAAKRASMAELSVPDADHRETALTIVPLSARTAREDPTLWPMVERASTVRVDGIDSSSLRSDSPLEKLVAFKDNLATCSGVEPLQIELHGQSGADTWASVMFKGPKEAAKCIRSHLEMRGKHGVKTNLRARTLLQSDLVVHDPVGALSHTTPQATERALYNSEGTDISRLPSISNVLRIKGFRTVTEWYAPGNRTSKHTSGPLIGTTEYEVSFMDTTPDIWVPAEWLGDVNAPQVLMMLGDMEERLQAADKFLENARKARRKSLKTKAIKHAAHFSVAMTHFSVAKATKLSKGPQWSSTWPPFFLAEEVLSDAIGDALAGPNVTQQDESLEDPGAASVVYHVRFSDSSKLWIPEDVMRLRMETWALVEIYKEEAATLAAIKTYVAEHPECATMQHTDLVQHLRTVHGWQGGSGLGRHRVGKLLRKVLKEQPTRTSNTSGVSRTRAATRARERSRQVEERKRLHRRRLKALPRSVTAGLDDSKIASRQSYGDTLEMLGSTRHKWRHRAVLDDTLPIVSHGRLSHANLAAASALPDERTAEITLSSQGDRLHSNLLALTDRSMPNELETAQSSQSSRLSRSLPELQLSRSAQEQLLLCETLTRRWEDEDTSIATIRATEALAESQRRTQRQLQAVHKSKQTLLGDASTPIRTSEREETEIDHASVSTPPESNGRKNGRKGSGTLRVRGGTLYARKYKANSAKKFQAQVFKDTWPYTKEKAHAEAEPQPEPDPEPEPEPEPAALSTAVALVDQTQELPPLAMRLTNLLEAGQRQREPLNTSSSRNDSVYQSGFIVSSGHGAGGVVLRPQVATLARSQSFFYVTAEGKRSEEVSAAALPHLLQSGVLTSETMVCALGWPAWTPLAECKDQLDSGGLLKSHAADLETNKHGLDLARHQAGLKGLPNSSLIEAGYSWNSLASDGIVTAAGGSDASLPASFADIGQSSLPRVSPGSADNTLQQAATPKPEPTSLSLDVSVTDASSVRHASSDASLLRQGQLRCRQQTLAPTPTRKQTAQGATASASRRIRGVPLSRTQRELAVLVADGFDASDALWALKKAGNGGGEEARDILLARLPERTPQYQIVEGESVRQNPAGYTACESLEEDYWRRRSFIDAGGETGLLLLGGAHSVDGGAGSAIPVQP